MIRFSSFARLGAALLLLTSLSSCEDILEQYFPNKPKPTPNFPSLGLDIPFYALSGGDKLDAYSTQNPATRTASVAITGLQNGEKLLAIDFRPATGQLYGVSSTSRLYIINQNTGAARAIGASAFTPAVQGNLVGFDFNPTVDRIRLVTSTGQNLRLNPETGTVVATDGVLSGAAGATITGAAYTNNLAGTAAGSSNPTELYVINTQNQQLYLVSPPNDGNLVPVGSLNLNISGDGGFDIDAKTGTALGLYSVQGKPTLFTVNLSTGAARPLAEYSANLGYSGIAIPTRPVGYVYRFILSTRQGDIYDLLKIDPTTSTSYGGGRISGLGDDVLISIDFRPATGQLYALSTKSRLYTIDLGSYVATPVATLSIPLESGGVDIDFNPVTDRLHIVNSTGQNLQVNPVDGTAIADGRLNPSRPTIFGVAYTNSTAGATNTSLYVLGADQPSSESKLYLQNPPNAGTFTEIGSLGVTRRFGDFDIGGTTNRGYALEGRGGTNNSGSIYSIDLATGRATELTTTPLDPSNTPSPLALAIGPGF